MPRIDRQGRLQQSHLMGDTEAVATDLLMFWGRLDLEQRRSLMSVDRKSFYEKIRENYCSRCYGLFTFRYDELKTSPQSVADCPACTSVCNGLIVDENDALTLSEALLKKEPFSTIAEVKRREFERAPTLLDRSCGFGYKKRPGVLMCTLHTNPVDTQYLLEYWSSLGKEQRRNMITMGEEEFTSTLDGHLKFSLKVCRQCRVNVLREFKHLKPGKAGIDGKHFFELCPGTVMQVGREMVQLECEMTDGIEDLQNLFEAAEVYDSMPQEAFDLNDECENDRWRHADTPAEAQAVLKEAATSLFRNQIELSFREQTAGNNALSLFVFLAFQMMETQLQNAFADLAAKQAEAELLKDEAREAEAKAKKKGKAKKAKALEAVKPKTSPLEPPSKPTPEVERSAVLANKTQQADCEASSLSPKAKPCPCKACAALQAGGSGDARCPSHTLSTDPYPSRPQTAGSQHSQSPSCLGGSDTTSEAGSALDGTTAADSDDGWEVISGKGRRRSMTGARKAASSVSTPVHTRSNSPVSVHNRTAAALAGVAAVAGSLRSAGRIVAVPITQGAGLTGSGARAMPPNPWGTARQAKSAAEKEGKTKASGAGGAKRALPRAVPILDSRLAAAEKEVMARLQNGATTAQPAPLEVHLEDSFEFPELPRKGNAPNISRQTVATLPQHAPQQDLLAVPQVAQPAAFGSTFDPVVLDPATSPPPRAMPIGSPAVVAQNAPQGVSHPLHGPTFAAAPGPPSFPGAIQSPSPTPQGPLSGSPRQHGLHSGATAPGSGFSFPAPWHTEQQGLQAPSHTLPSGLPSFPGGHHAGSYELPPSSTGLPAQPGVVHSVATPSETKPSMAQAGYTHRPFSLFAFSPILGQDSQPPTLQLINSPYPVYQLWGAPTPFPDVVNSRQNPLGCSPSF